MMDKPTSILYTINKGILDCFTLSQPNIQVGHVKMLKLKTLMKVCSTDDKFKMDKRDQT